MSGDVAAAKAATNTALATAEGLLADNKVLISDLTAQAGAAGADPAIAQALSEARAANKRLLTTTDALAHGLRRPGFHGQFSGNRGERAGYGDALSL